MMPSEDRAVRKALSEFLGGKSAHAGFEEAMRDFPASLYGTKPEGMTHTGWELLEHIRMALHDLLDFCVNPKYRAPKWPEGYWPEKDAPDSSASWDASVKAVLQDVHAFEKILQSSGVDLYAKIPWGEGQNILREILLAGSHTSYHVGQLILLRKQLGAWKS